MHPRFFFLVLLVSVIALPARSLAASPWLTDLDSGKHAASRSSKPLLVLFTNSEDPDSCGAFDKEVLSSREFQRFAKDYVLVRIDVSPTPAPTSQARERIDRAKLQFHIRQYPTVVLATSAGRERASQMGYDAGEGAKAYLDPFENAGAD